MFFPLDHCLLSVTSSSPSIAHGTTSQFTATGLFSDGSRQDLTATVVWSTSAAEIAIVAEGGLARGVSPGRATIAASFEGKSASASLTVTAAVLQSLEIRPATLSLAKGTSSSLTLRGLFSDGSSQDLTENIDWSSSAPEVAAVTNSGAVWGVSLGQAVVTARRDGLSATMTVAVTSALLRSIEVTPSPVNLSRGSSQQFVATGTFSDASSQDLTSSVSWSSSTPHLSISNADGSRGVATALQVTGNATVAAKLGDVEGTATAAVTAAILKTLVITPAAPTVAQRATLQLRATGTYSDGSTQDLTSSVQWSSGTERVGKVGAGGVLTGGVNAEVASAETVVTATLGGVSTFTTATVVRSSGSAFAWGWNSSGQLGNGESGADADRNAPVAVLQGYVPEGVSFTAVSAGWNHSLAIGDDGKLYSWGDNLYGRLGNGTSGDGTNSNVPVAVARGDVPGEVTFVAVTTGDYHSLAIGSDGKLYAWGYNLYGQLGNGDSGAGASRNAPVAVLQDHVPEGVSFTAVSVGDHHSLALGSDGKLYSWGRNNSGQLGNGTSGDNTASNRPTAVSRGDVPDGVTFTAISAGEDHNLALSSDGKLYTWGKNSSGQLGNGSSDGLFHAPVAVAEGDVPDGVTFTAISARWNHCLAIGSNGKLYAWGSNVYGQLGNGVSGVGMNSNVPVAVAEGDVPDGVAFTAISAGELYNLALGSDGRLYSWGRNNHGQLGNGTSGTSADSNLPVLVGYDGMASSGKPITLFDAGGYHSLVLSFP